MPIGLGEGDIGFIIGDGEPIMGECIIGFMGAMGFIIGEGDPIIGLGLPIMA
jgi:hypothetical protein